MAIQYNSQNCKKTKKKQHSSSIHEFNPSRKGSEKQAMRIANKHRQQKLLKHVFDKNARQSFVGSSKSWRTLILIIANYRLQIHNSDQKEF